MENEIGKRIRLYRKMKHITQEELAKKVGVAAPTITRYETGDRQPSIRQIRKIASALDVSIDELIGMGQVEQEAPKEQKEETNLAKKEVMELLEQIEDEKALTRIKHMIIGMGFVEE